MDQQLYAIDEKGDSVLESVLTPFFKTIFPAFFRKAESIRIRANLVTGEVKADYANEDRTTELIPSDRFQPFVASSRIRILAGLSILPETEKQVGQIRVCFMQNSLDVVVAIEVKNDVETLLLNPLWH